MTMQQITIPHLQIGDFRIKTPVGLAELLEPAWCIPKEDDGIEKFVSKFTRSVFRNEEGKLVTEYVKTEVAK